MIDRAREHKPELHVHFLLTLDKEVVRDRYSELKFLIFEVEIICHFIINATQMLSSVMANKVILVKRVRFDDRHVINRVVTWTFAYQAARVSE